jgi:hypothetical protein
MSATPMATNRVALDSLQVSDDLDLREIPLLKTLHEGGYAGNINLRHPSAELARDQAEHSFNLGGVRCFDPLQEADRQRKVDRPQPGMAERRYLYVTCPAGAAFKMDPRALNTGRTAENQHRMTVSQRACN